MEPIQSVGAVQETGERFSDTLDVPGELAGRVIGPGGATLKALEAATGARVLVDKPGSKREAVRVHVFAPSEESLERARRQLQALVGGNIQARATARRRFHTQRCLMMVAPAHTHQLPLSGANGSQPGAHRGPRCAWHGQVAVLRWYRRYYSFATQRMPS